MRMSNEMSEDYDEILRQEIYEQFLEMGMDEMSADILASEQMEYLTENGL